VLVDTTVWVDFFAGLVAPHVQALELFISENEDLCICGVILTEVLQGIRDDKDYERTKKYLEALIYFSMRRETFVKAADLYRSLRRKGVTIWKPVDCMIASVALEHDIPLLHNDRDFDSIATHCGLKAVKFR
jgi:hypothetical protein